MDLSNLEGAGLRTGRRCLLLIVALAGSPAVAEAAPPLAEVLRCGKAEVRKVALTFDDGPTRRFTPPVLQILAREQVKGTFFVLGRATRREPGLVKQISQEGHLLALHSYSHLRRGSVEQWREELRRNLDAVQAAGVKPAAYFRPPHGTVTAPVRQVASELGYTILLYTMLSSDWTRPGTAALVRQVVGGTGPGGIVVLHDGGGERSQTVEALPEIIRGLRRRGLEPVRLDELLGPRPSLERCASGRE